MPEARKVTPTPPASEPATDTDRICAEIVAGRHAGGLVRILDAIHHAFSHGRTSKRWKVDLSFLGGEYVGRVFTEDEFGFDEACRAEKIAARSWALLDPILVGNDCRAIILAHLIEHGVPEADARQLVGRVGFNTVAEAITVYEVPDDPKAERTSNGATST